MAKDCPNCGLINPPDTQRCDCGFDFGTRQTERSYSTPGTRADIKRAWIAAVVSATWTLAVTLVAVLSGDKRTFSGLFDAWTLIDVAITYALAFGIYRKSRICAVLMLAMFILGQVVARLEVWDLSGILVPLIFVYLFAQGVRGTFVYQRDVSHPAHAATENPR